MSETKRPLKVFLCHASADKSKVRELYRYLRKRGIQPWLDVENLLAGQDWQVEIPKAIASSDAIIVCLSKNSVDKEGYVQNEISFALDRALSMPEGRIFLIPARLEECDLPFSLKRYHWVDLFETDGYTKLMRSLKTRASQLHRVNVEMPKEVKLDAFSSAQSEKLPPNMSESYSTENIKHLPPIGLFKSPSDSNNNEPININSNSVIHTSKVRQEDFSHPETTPKSTPIVAKQGPPPQSKHDGDQRTSKNSTNKGHGKNIAIVVALIGAVATICASVIGILPQYFKFTPILTATRTRTRTLTRIPITPTSSLTLRPSSTPKATKTRTVTLSRTVTSSPTLTFLPATATSLPFESCSWTRGESPYFTYTCYGGVSSNNWVCTETKYKNMAAKEPSDVRTYQAFAYWEVRPNVDQYGGSCTGDPWK